MAGKKGTGDQRRTCDRGIDLEDVGLDPEDLCRLFDDIYRMVLAYPTFSVEVVLEEADVWLGWIVFREELSIRGDVHRWRLHLGQRGSSATAGGGEAGTVCAHLL